MGRPGCDDHTRNPRPHLPPGKIGCGAAWHCLRAFVTEAVEEKLAAATQDQQKPWVKLAGGLERLHKETVRINAIMRSGFEKIEPEEWE